MVQTSEFSELARDEFIHGGIQDGEGPGLRHETLQKVELHSPDKLDCSLVVELE